MVQLMTVVLAVLATTMFMACQGPEPGSEVLRNIPKQKLTDSHRDVTTKVSMGGLAREDTRYVIKITYNSQKKPIQVLIRSIKPNGENYSGDEASNGCVDKFVNPSIKISGKNENKIYTIKETKVGNVSVEMVFNFDTGELNDFSYEHAIEAKYTKEQKGKNHEITDKGKFDQRYFPDDVEFCEDSSPSTSATNSP